MNVCVCVRACVQEIVWTCMKTLLKMERYAKKPIRTNLSYSGLAFLEKEKKKINLKFVAFRGFECFRLLVYTAQ